VGQCFLMTNQQKLIGTILIICLSISSAAYAIEPLQKDLRLNMGFFAGSITDHANRADIEVSLNFWAKEVFETTANRNSFAITSSKAILFDRIEELKKAFDQGDLDIIIAPPLLIARYFNREDLSDGYAGVLEGKKADRLILITRIDKNINQIRDLRGKRLVINDNDELAEVFIDTLVLTDLKLSYKDIGLSIQHQNKSSRSVLDVFFDKADAAIVYGSSYEIMADLNPDIKNTLKILAEYPMKSKNFSYFRHDYPLRNDLNAVAIAFNNSARGKQILELFRVEEIDYCEVNELDIFDKYYKDYLRIKQLAKK
jgi:ABC-type phosphate/phosphonate transport system substrate-binding protein